MLTDSFNRRFNYLRLSITDACNFRCNYCLPDGYCTPPGNIPLSLPEIEAAVRAFAFSGTHKIRLTGGEPTLRKDLPEIIQCCKQVEGINTVALTTNGYRLHKDIDDYLNAGLDALNISLDSLRPDMFRLITGHNKLQQILKTIEQTLAKGLTRLKINAVLMQDFNYPELNHFLDWIKDTPVTLRFIELMQTGDNTDFYHRQHVNGQAIQIRLEQEGWLPIIRAADAGPALEYRHPDYAGNIGLIMPYSKDFCTTCNRLRLSSTGKLHLCLFADDNSDLRPFLLTESTEQLAARLQQRVYGKKAGHELASQNTGSTQHLAMLGG